MPKEPDMTLSADGEEPFADPFEEMRHLLNSLDADRSDIQRMDVSLYFGEAEDSDAAELEAGSEADEATEEVPKSGSSAVLTDPSIDVEVEELEDGWLRVRGEAGSVEAESKRGRALAILVNAGGDREAFTSVEFGQVGVEAGLADTENNARAPLSALYRKGLVERRLVTDDRSGLHFEYRPSPAGAALVDDWAV